MNGDFPYLEKCLVYRKILAMLAIVVAVVIVMYIVKTSNTVTSFA